MANVALKREVDQMIGLTDDDTKLLDGFVISLPGGWQYEFDGEDCSRLQIWRSGFVVGTSPLIVVDRTSDMYLVTICDPVGVVNDPDLGNTEHEVFECETIGDAIVEVQGLVCDLMRTEDYSMPTPSSWSSCRDCDSCALSAANCTKWNPSARLRAA
jgi:hypothetical protein